MRNEQRGILASRENCTANGFRKQLIFDLNGEKWPILAIQMPLNNGSSEQVRFPGDGYTHKGEKIAATTPQPKRNYTLPADLRSMYKDLTMMLHAAFEAR